VLVVSHESTYTGAPINLLHLLRWVTTNTDVEVHTLLLRDGPLHERFAEVGEVTALDGPAWRELFDRDTPPPSRVAAGVRGATSRGSWARRQVRHLSGFDLIYLNSVASVAILPHLPENGPIVCHVHEMGVALATLSGRNRRLLTNVPSRWIAASAAVRDDLVSETGVDEADVRVHHEFIDARRISELEFEPRVIERLRRRQEIPEDAAIVMGAGTMEWRKGVDLFVQLAAAIARRTREPIRFVWVGGELSGIEWTRMWADCGRAGVRDLVRFVGTHPNPEHWFSAADVFALTSHEDPFPLVCLEHAAMAHPVVTFANGGMVELLRPAGPETSSCVIPHLDVGGMADRILALLDSDELRTTVGRQLERRVLEHHDVEVAAPRLWADIEELLP
jgi:glycosyltransferase involved in cell wall biosynthesis